MVYICGVRYSSAIKINLSIINMKKPYKEYTLQEQYRSIQRGRELEFYLMIVSCISSLVLLFAVLFL